MNICVIPSGQRHMIYMTNTTVITGQELVDYASEALEIPSDRITMVMCGEIVKLGDVHKMTELLKMPVLQVLLDYKPI